MCKALLQFLALVSFTTISGTGNANEQFEDYEIRVIKQKDFQKAGRVEAAGAGIAVVNQAFISTLMAGGQLGYHFTETWALHAEGWYGGTFNKSDCETLGRKFNIDLLIDETKSFVGLKVSYTPVYGKFQLSNGSVLYFDWLFDVGGGMASLTSRKSTCSSNSPGDSNSAMNPQFNVGTGQRFFMNKSLAVNWGVRLMMAKPAPSPGKAQDEGTLFNGVRNVIFSIGAGYYF